MEKSEAKEFDINKRTRKFAVSILKFCHLIRKRSTEYFLQDQLARSGTSIGANIREAKGSSSKKEFCRFYEIALRSANESEYWLEVLSDLYEFPEIKEIQEELGELRKIIASIIIRLKRDLNK